MSRTTTRRSKRTPRTKVARTARIASLPSVGTTLATRTPFPSRCASLAARCSRPLSSRSLTRLRIVRRRNRAPGTAAARPSPHPRAETLLRREAKTYNADHLDIALRTLARSTSGAQLPRLLAVRLADDAVEVLLDEPLERAPRGFVDTGLRRTWKTQTAANWEALDRYARDTVHPAPALVHVGNRGADEYLIDLETAGVLSICGDREECVAFLEHVLNQVTAPGVNQHVDLMVVGKELHSLAGDENVRRYDTLRDAANDVEQIAQVTTRALDTAGCATTFEARQADPTDTWAPTLLLCADEPDPDDLSVLSSLHSGTGNRARLSSSPPRSVSGTSISTAGPCCCSRSDSNSNPSDSRRRR